MPSRKQVVLVTGANGEMGHGLIGRLAASNTDYEIVGLDIAELKPELAALCSARIVGDVLDQRLLERLVSEYEIHAIFHLAALLSTRSEFTPETAHAVNVGGTLNLLKLAVEQSRWHGHPVKFIFPSSIAVYGLPDLPTKAAAGRVVEHQWNVPTTMYGCNKLYCEQLGRYYSLHYRQLDAARRKSGVDFRAIRFPGLISAVTLPSGGTSDFAPEMLHAAAAGEGYDCFVPEGTRIPFMAMTDAISALVQLERADAEALTQRVYNINAFSLSAGELRSIIGRAFPDATIGFSRDPARTGIVDTWPARVDDSAARRDWGWLPEHDADSAFGDHLIPAIAARYRK